MCEDLKETKCPPDPKPLPPDDFSYASEMMEAMGAKAGCKTDRGKGGSWGIAAVGGVVAGIPMGGFGAGGSSTQNDVSIGCQKMQAVAQEFKLTQRNIVCALSQTCNKQVNTLYAEQLLKFDCAEDIFINGNINQNMSVRMINSFNLSQDEESYIEGQLKSTTKQVSDMLSDSKSGFLGSTDGQNQAQEIRSKVDAFDYKAVISQSINDFNNSMKAGQTIDIKGRKRCIVTGDINQTMQIEMLANSIINKTLKGNFKTIFDTINEQDSKLVQKSAESNNKMWTTLIIGIIVVLVLIVVGVILYKVFSKKSETTQYALDKGYNTGSYINTEPGRQISQSSPP